MPDAVDTVIFAPDDEWRYHPKHVLQFTDINKLYIVASCWTSIDINQSILRRGKKLPLILRSIRYKQTQRTDQEQFLVLQNVQLPNHNLRDTFQGLT
jgi:hypothetical protein